jgi:hypothetical protein
VAGLEPVDPHADVKGMKKNTATHGRVAERETDRPAHTTSYLARTTSYPAVLAGYREILARLSENHDPCMGELTSH